ncbi:hypothetical protein ACIQXG_21745 [Lysinibacillus sphaericus]|uniref:hypothetical protein n=1 Tax=Lysinibacillus sphaericus TaxID=1421 RepID=UPI003828643C
MNDKLYELLKVQFRVNCNERINGNEHIKKEIVSITRTNLEETIQQNSHLLNGEMDLKAVLKDFFNILKAELEETRDDYIDFTTEFDEDDSLDCNLEHNREYINSSNEDLKFAIEVEKYELNSFK